MSLQADDALMAIFGLHRVEKTIDDFIGTIYGCQSYDINRLCRFDRRAIDHKCDGCERVTDREYLVTSGLWVDGVSHADKR